MEGKHEPARFFSETGGTEHSRFALEPLPAYLVVIKISSVHRERMAPLHSEAWGTRFW